VASLVTSDGTAECPQFFFLMVTVISFQHSKNKLKSCPFCLFTLNEGG
jgi:hypothetical protein